MHDVLAQVVSLEGSKLLTLAQKPERLDEDALGALEILARCAKSLKADPAPSNDPPPSTEDALKLVDGGDSH